MDWCFEYVWFVVDYVCFFVFCEFGVVVCWCEEFVDVGVCCVDVFCEVVLWYEF